MPVAGRFAVIELSCILARVDAFKTLAR
jgi:hypothetical protein